MKVHELLLREMPQLIPPIHGSFIAAGVNDCLQHLNTSTVVERFDEHAALYKFDLTDVGYYFVYNRKQPIRDRVEYFVRYHTISFDSALGPSKAIRQVLIWRNKRIMSVYSANVTKKVFWEHLFPKYRCLASDTMETKDGQRFWSAVLGDALGRGLTVRIVNTNDRTFIDVGSASEFMDRVKGTWGSTRWFQRMVVVIFED